MSRIRRVSDEREMERLIDELITRGYTIKSQGQRSARMKKKEWGGAFNHLVVAGLTIWWTFGLGNILFGIYKRYTAEEVTIKIDDQGPDSPPRYE